MSQESQVARAWDIVRARVLRRTKPLAVLNDSDGRLTVDWPDPDITEVVIGRDALAGLIRDLNVTRGH